MAAMSKPPADTTQKRGSAEQPAVRPGRLPQVSERRAWVRYKSRLKLVWQLLGMAKDELWLAKVQDVSATGIGLIVNRSVPRGTVLSLYLAPKSARPPDATPLPDELVTAESPAVLVQVKHVTTLSPHECLLGCAFFVKLTEEELRDLLV
jgi:hypothetical protein